MAWQAAENGLWPYSNVSSVETGDHGKIVAIDIETGAFEVAEDTIAASDRLRARYPNAEVWFVRVGHRAAHRFGHYGGVTPS